MKFVLAALALLAIASPLNAWKVPASGSGALAKELQDIVDLVPLNEVVSIIKAYIAQDQQVQAVLKIATSSETAAYVKEIEAVPEFKLLANYIQKAGLDIYRILNAVNKALNLAPITPLDTYKPISGKGVAGLLNDLKDVVPLQKIQELLDEKKENSPVFKDVLAEIQSSKYKEIGEVAVKSVHVANIHNAANKAGVSDNDFAYGFSVLLVSHVIRSLH
ncbi:protein G12-like [Halictus rubicundus]|uniref:protein G12-like n=1 Tax=Halictus rubicundus TaxID=77578 RepID=UPI0040354731